MKRSAEITLYDELGVETDASPEEIRDAFRALIRILHPDHQTEPQLREIAGKQTRKLNRCYEVLSDPERRRRYDASLHKLEMGRALILSPRSPVSATLLTERVAWMAALGFVVIALVWLSWDNPGVVQQQVAEHTPKKVLSVVAPSSNASAVEMTRLQSELRRVATERDLAVQELTRLRAPVPKPQSTWAPAEPVRQSAPPAVTAMLEVPQPVPASPAAVLPQTSRAPLQAAARAAVRPFAGFWFYSKDTSQRDRTSAVYPPEFIETTITEQNGMVRGKYRSRYRIADRAISPDVVFEFAGTANGSTVVCPWTGPGGAKGELTLKMAGENGLMVDWTATDLGSLQGLVTGTATLTRRIE